MVVRVGGACKTMAAVIENFPFLRKYLRQNTPASNDEKHTQPQSEAGKTNLQTQLTPLWLAAAVSL